MSQNSLCSIAKWRNYPFDSAAQTVIDSVTPSSLFSKFEEDKKNKITFKKWNVIQPQQYKNILFRYMTMGENAKIPMDLLDDWFLGIIVKNTAELQTFSDIFGHSDYCPFDVLNQFLGKKVTNKDEIKEELKKIGFKSWALLPDGVEAFSDFGMNQIWEIISEYHQNMLLDELLCLINRAINVIHQRSDLSVLFIKGGKRACSEISNAKKFLDYI